MVNTFLSRVEKPSSKTIMFIFATNHPEALDRAVWSRIGNKVEFKLPALQQRKELIEIYLSKHVIKLGIEVDDELKEAVLAQAKRMEGFSAREIEQVMVDFQTAVDDFDSASLTLDMVKKVVDKKVAEYELAQKLEEQKQKEEGYHGFAGESGALQLSKGSLFAEAA